MIVTNNLRDFSREALDPFGVEVQTPDAFVRNLIDLDAQVVARILVE